MAAAATVARVLPDPTAPHLVRGDEELPLRGDGSASERRLARLTMADPDGPVRGVEGLFVTDASAFPTVPAVNPMLSIMALARRTALRMPS